MWYFVLVAISATVYFASKRWGRQLYYRWGRLIPFRRAIVNKSRPPTPPLIDTTVPIVPGGVSGTGEEGYPLLTTKEEYDDDRLHTVLSMSTDDYRKATLFASGSFDQDFQIPDLIGQTEILSEEHREKLCAHLPARAEGYSWSLVFSTSQHGFSLNSLYRKMHKLESPILIVIEDTDHNVFGALTSCSLHVSDHFYGTGESLLYKFNPHFKVFHWSGENLYFIKGNPESLAIGAGDGKFGLWLDGDLNQGRSQHCSTYSNEPLAPQEDFVIKTLECWAFV
uniref:Oxidation resistance protein 1 n=1 Tax=Anopheles funestus TaxID=62324 RepID=A0A4Y0BI69_ANOFN